MNWKDFDGGSEAQAAPEVGGTYRIEQQNTDASHRLNGYVWYRIRWNDTPVASTRSLSAAKWTAETDNAERVKGKEAADKRSARGPPTPTPLADLPFPYVRKGWWLTPTALFRSHMPPVFLRPTSWPKGCWKC